jgi:hypothetical protein
MDLLESFKLYRVSHPNLANCWLAYLELKKRHYDERTLHQSAAVLKRLADGCADFTRADIVRLLLYQQINKA